MQRAARSFLDPLSDPPASIPLLELAEFGLSESDLGRTLDTSHFLGMKRGTLRELLKALRETYCRTIGVEYLHIQDTHIRHWDGTAWSSVNGASIPVPPSGGRAQRSTGLNATVALSRVRKRSTLIRDRR